MVDVKLEHLTSTTVALNLEAILGKGLTFTECYAAHRVGRVLSLFSSGRNWDSPSPSLAGECAPPPSPPRFWGERGTLAGERGVGTLGESLF
jgi:hypothetical protein